MASSFEQSTTRTPKKQKIRTVIRNAVEQDWTGANVIPDKGELVYGSDVNTLKIGDGVTTYANLPAISGGGSGTSDYTQLNNKPSINDVTLVGNKTAADLGFATVATSGDYDDLTDKPTLGTMAAESADDYTKTSSLSSVALSGDYDDLIDKPTLGTAAAASTTDFATAAQGALADTALQPGALDNYVTTNTAQTITADKSFNGANISTNSNIEFTSVTSALVSKRNGATRNLITRTNFNEVNVGNPYDPTVILGNGTRPHYNTTEYLALYSDIPTVNNATITITQGGVTKGSFTLNQSTADTIALDATTGTSDYTQLLNKPEINGNVLTGDKTASQLGFANVATSGSYTDLIDRPTLATVATSGSYNDLSNKPTIPAAQVNSDWNASSGVAQILNKPSLATVATSGSYTDLSNKPILTDFTTSTQQDAIDSGANSTNIAQITTNTNDISTINGKIPSAASTSNQLADKAFVNSSISNMAANYVTSDAQGDNFATHAALIAGPYYYKGQSYTLTNNDYALVESDEDHNNATTRYMYDGAQWAFQYIVNNAPFTQAQLDAINSTITSTLVTSYSNHIADTDIHVTSADKTTWSGKQDALVSGTNIKTINNQSLLGSGNITITGGGLPSQTGNNGKFLTTDGTDASWVAVANVATSGSYSDLSGTPAIPVVVQDFWVDSTTGAITCTFSDVPVTKVVHTIIGNTTIAGTWSGNVFTPTTAADILNNANGFVVSVA